MLRASVIVPARDAAQTLPRTLAALACQELEGEYEVIVVDDGSRDETARVASAAPGRPTLLPQPPRGPAAARNLAVRRSSAPALAFCDADVFPSGGWLAAGLRALETADIVQGMVLPDPTAVIGPFDRTIRVTRPAGLFETANLFTTREVFDRAGGFEDWLRPTVGKAMAEDVWFGYRARRLGARFGFCAEALAHHAVTARSWREYALERRRLEYFPAMVRKMPELRQTFLYRRLFLNRRTARLDLALAGAAAACALSSPLPLLAALPYARVVGRECARSRPAGPPRPAVGAADVAADLVGLVAMAKGSVEYRAIVA